MSCIHDWRTVVPDAFGVHKGRKRVQCKKCKDLSFTGISPKSRIMWKPIHTAEKVQGSKILCYSDGYVFEAECEYDDGEGTWCSIGGDEPTHWMPLPLPPGQEV